MSMTLTADAAVSSSDFVVADAARPALARLGERYSILHLVPDDRDERWGPFAIDAGPGAAAWRRNPTIELPCGPEGEAEFILAGLLPVVVIGCGLARHPHAARAVERVRRGHDTSVVIDMDEHPVAAPRLDVATFGDDAARSRALLRLLAA